jgi:hypothetical protein
MFASRGLIIIKKHWGEIDLNTIKPCPNCKHDISYEDEFEYGGSGPPPIFSVTCGDCGVRGPSALGVERGDNIGAINYAISHWNELPRR